MQRLVQTYSAPNPAFLGHLYLVNQVDSSRQLAKDVTQVLLAHLGDRVVGLIHQDQSVTEALACNQSVLEYDTNSQGTLDFAQLARWVIDRLAQAEQPA